MHPLCDVADGDGGQAARCGRAAEKEAGILTAAGRDAVPAAAGQCFFAADGAARSADGRSRPGAAACVSFAESVLRKGDFDGIA